MWEGGGGGGYGVTANKYSTVVHMLEPKSQGDDSSPPPLCGLIFFEGDRCLCLTLKFVERLKCYSAKPNESCINFDIYYFISCLISIVILSLCNFLFLLSFLVRYRVKTMHGEGKNVSNSCMRPQYDLARLSTQ